MSYLKLYCESISEFPIRSRVSSDLASKLCALFAKMFTIKAQNNREKGEVTTPTPENLQRKPSLTFRKTLRDSADNGQREASSQSSSESFLDPEFPQEAHSRRMQTLRYVADRIEKGQETRLASRAAKTSAYTAGERKAYFGKSEAPRTKTKELSKRRRRFPRS